MKFSSLLMSAALIAVSTAADDDTTSGVLVLTGTTSAAVTPTYISYTTTITRDTNTETATVTSSIGTISNSASTMAASNGSMTGTATTTSESVTVLVGSSRTTTSLLNSTSSLNSTSTNTTSASAEPTNTTPCNNYPEFCYRKYSNITMVSAHNSPFVSKVANAAANQVYDVTQQLNDGIRLIQGQTHKVNGTLRYCHTTCELFDAGPMTDYLTDVYNWVNTHPYDVVTILIGNGDYVWVENYTAPLEASGLVKYAYIPPKIPMALDDWPTLASMILTGKRVVFFMDYNANPTSVPYVLDEFSQMWESPFDPTNRSFPCNVERPPGLSLVDAQNRMYMTNHNLNTDLTIPILSTPFSVPTTPLLNVTNNVTGYGSLGEGAQICYQDYGRPPNFLNVDYYNVGNGSVFEVAAKWNNVTYDRPCCGIASTSGAAGLGRFGDGVRVWAWTLAAAVGVAVLI